MSKRIPQAFIQSLLDRVDIIDVIDARVPLKKKGINYSACCPFHQEKTPSFSVNQSKQFFYCFGCGKNGNAITFLLEYDNIDFVDAVEELAKSVGMEVPREVTESRSNPAETQALFDALEKASQHYQQQLRTHEKKQEAINYLKSRQLSGQTAKDFGIGYAPEGWDGFKKSMPSSAESAMIQSGLLVKNDQGRTYDRFRHRIMFPIRDRRGRTVGFGGRVMSPEDTPKYLNSPETPVFHKGELLYGLYEARKKNNHFDQLLIVEGYMDVVSLYEHSISFALAALGTATSASHLKIAFKLCKKLTFCFDGDTAGKNAAIRAMEVTLPVLTGAEQVNFLFLPEGQDPDTMVQSLGKDAFLEEVANATPLSSFFIDTLTQGLDLTCLEGRSQLISKALPYLNKMQRNHFLDLLIDQISQLAQIAPVKIKRQLAAKNNTESPNKPTGRMMANGPLEKVIAFLIQHPDSIAQLPAEPLVERSDEHTLYNELTDFIRQNSHLNAAQIFEHFRNHPKAARIAQLALVDFDLPPEAQIKEVIDIIQKYSSEPRELAIARLTEKSKKHTLSPEEKQQLKQLLQESHQ